MIPLIPAISIVGVISLGLLLYAGVSLLEIQDLQRASAANTQERLQERLRGEYEGTPVNIQQAVILSEWTDDSNITAVLVKCDDGRVFTIPTSILVHGGELIQLPSSLLNDMAARAGSC